MKTSTMKLNPLVTAPPKVELPFVKLDAVLTRDGELVIFAWPDDEDENHNCDGLGCGFDHVLWRGRADADLHNRFNWLEAKAIANKEQGK